MRAHKKCVASFHPNHDEDDEKFFVPLPSKKTLGARRTLKSLAIVERNMLAASANVDCATSNVSNRCSLPRTRNGCAIVSSRAVVGDVNGSDGTMWESISLQELNSPNVEAAGADDTNKWTREIHVANDAAEKQQIPRGNQHGDEPLHWNAPIGTTVTNSNIRIQESVKNLNFADNHRRQTGRMWSSSSSGSEFDRRHRRHRERSRTGSMVDQLLDEIYDQCIDARRTSVDSDTTVTEYSTTVSDYYFPSCALRQATNANRFTRNSLRNYDCDKLNALCAQFKPSIFHSGQVLTRQLKKKDKLKIKRDRHYDVITAILQAVSEKRRVDTRMKFSIEPFAGDSGFNQWHDAMKMVARLPGGVPPEFRKRLWLTLADRHIQHRKIDWPKTRQFCFNERSNPDDDNLGVQIVKDLHRTGCSLFCGEDAEHNQALLKRVLLAYARWNKTVGYCQGFNMLAALILEVMNKKEDDALKVMILLIEGVLPDSYFADNLRGLSVDMAVFRDLLKLRLSFLSRHLEKLQMEARDGATGTTYEPPLTNVFTMQWFLTLFSNCLPKSTVLRVWDLIFLEGSEVLLRTGLAIWDGLADRIMTVESADEFYSIMAVLTREMLEFGLMDANYLVKTIVQMASFPFPQLGELRDKYTYNITPFTSAVGAARRGLRMFYSDDDDEDEDDQQIAVATWCLHDAFPPAKSPDKGRECSGYALSPSSTNFNSIGPGAFGPGCLANLPSPSKHNIDMERMTLDISALKKQYFKLRERQKQAKIILTAGARQFPNKIERPPIAVNHLLLGKKALSSKNRKSKNPTIKLRNINDAKKRPQLKRQMSMDPKFFGRNKSPSSSSSERRDFDPDSTLMWRDVTNDVNRLKVPTELSDFEIGDEAEQFAKINARRRSVDSHRSNANVQKRTQDDDNDDDDDDSGSSTSTELCDDPEQFSDVSSTEECANRHVAALQLQVRVDHHADNEQKKCTERRRTLSINSAPSTPCGGGSFIGDDETSDTFAERYDDDASTIQNDVNDGRGADIRSDVIKTFCDRDQVPIININTSDDDDNKRTVRTDDDDDDDARELREAVKFLRLTPRKHNQFNNDDVTDGVVEDGQSTTERLHHNSFTSGDDHATGKVPDEVICKNQDHQLTSSKTYGCAVNSLPVSPTSPLLSPCRFTTYPLVELSVADDDDDKADKRRRQRTMSTPTSPVHGRDEIDQLKYQRTISNHSNSLSESTNSSNYSLSPPCSPSKHQNFNPFPTRRTGTRSKDKVGIKFGLYRKSKSTIKDEGDHITVTSSAKDTCEKS
ncbi:TBC1D30 (predicted) [Pycnogonum litorale]